MGDITVTVDGTTITGFVSATGFYQLIVDSDITEIGDNAFENNTNIFFLDLSNATSLTTIGYAAFRNCSNLLQIENSRIPSSVTSIQRSAFEDCSKLTGHLVIPSSVKIIGGGAFKNAGITSLDLSKATSLTTIGNYAFLSCKNLTGDLVIPSSVISIGNVAFGLSKITSLDLSNATSLTSIGSRAFVNTSITSLDLSNATSLTTIDQSAFIGCSNLTGDLLIPSSVTSIGDYAFQNTNITSLDLSNATSLISIGAGAFRNTNITSLDLSNAKSLTTIGVNSFLNCKNLTGDLVIPNKVTTIKEWSFSSITLDNLYFLSETPPSFSLDWQPTLTGKVYVLSEATKNKYISTPNFGFNADQVEIIGVSGKELINIDEKSTGSEQYTTIAGFSATKWEIVMTEGEKPEWLTIDNQGLLSWTDQCAIGTYKFKIKATNDLQTSIESAPITFVVNESIKPEPEPSKSNIPLILGLLIVLGILSF